jgi:hypothetical protein
VGWISNLAGAMRLFLAIACIALGAAAHADDPIRLADKSDPGSEYRVVADSVIAGELLAPVAKGKPPERIKISGKSTIDYLERVLPVDPKDAEHRSLRVYNRMDFKKLTGDRTDESSLRSAVRRLVLMKKGHAKVPFSPDGPLMWSEIDLLRTDYMVAALAGMLPEKAVEIGDTWTPTPEALVELTDLEKIQKSDLICTLDLVQSNGPRRIAHVTFKGNITGINEDGPVRQKLAGKLQVDLGAASITYLKIEGEHYLLDDKGKDAGRITGTFELTRTSAKGHKLLADAAIKDLELNPTEENTRLLYDSEETGVRFVHPRNWRVVRMNGRQITLDESSGAGLLITLESPESVPAPAKFQREAIKELTDRGARITNRTGPESLGEGVDRFTFDGELAREAVTMDYFVLRQERGGAIFAARIPARQREARMKELERLARSFTVTRRLSGK